MANFLDKFKITTAWESKRHTKDLSCEHITTSNFMELAPVYYHNTIPKEKLEIDFRAFARLAPMPVPTFGRANMNIRAFFVPFRTIMADWNDFITDAIHAYPDGTHVIPSTVRRVKNSTLVNVLIDASDSVNPESVQWDFKVVGNTSADEFYKLRPYSRSYLKVLESLGYHLNFNLSLSATQETYFSALPLLAYAKVIADWYFPSQYAGNISEWYSLDKVLTRQVNGDELTKNEVYNILGQAWVNYDSDYFVSAFDTPAGPPQTEASDFSIADPSSTPGSTMTVESHPQNEYYGSERANTAYWPNDNGLLTQYAVEALHRLSDYLKRHQLAGARALDRYLARFGVNLAAEKMNRSIYLGSHKIPLMTGDVMATSDTLSSSGGSRVGDYAGKGFLVGQDGHFAFETDEYGLFIICSSIVPEVGYFQGVDRHNLHQTRLDFLTPEFDGMGTRAIAKCEAYLSMDATDQDRRNMSEIFGFTPQYSEYKVGRDFLTGDYRLRSLNAAGDSSEAWHLFRDLSELQYNPVHNLSFVNGRVDANQYDRIFYNTDRTADKFYLHYFFGVKSTSNALPLYDEYDFHNEGEAEKRVMDVNGVKMN